MSLIQIVGLIFCIFMLINSIVKTKRREISIFEGFIWSLVWIIALILISYPNYMSDLAEYFGVGRGIDVVIYLSIIILFYLVYKLYAKIDKLEREITLLVREIAIRDRYEPKKRN